MSLERVGVVLIGRNEGARLAGALSSIPERVAAVVYVDSGSTDDSLLIAAEHGAKVVELDAAGGFTAARGRNAGFAHLRSNHPDLEYVQFVDGDCLLVHGWLEAAVAFLDAEPATTAVCGNRNEQYPDASLFNAVCQVEWNQAQPGEVRAFAGDVVIRCEAVERAGGYDPAVVAGEDDEFSVRIRAGGGRIVRLDHDMTLHDVAMTKLSQWWKRAERAGYGYTLVNRIHGAPPERYFAPQVRRAVVWGAAVPLTAAASARLHRAAPLGAVVLYGARVARIARRTHDAGWAPRTSWAWATSCVAASIPQAIGVAKFSVDRLRGRGPEIIEYK